MVYWDKVMLTIIICLLSKYKSKTKQLWQSYKACKA